MALAAARARSAIASVMSTPMARPSGPTAFAANSRSIPAPQPMSTTVAPGRHQRDAMGIGDSGERRGDRSQEAAPTRPHRSQASRLRRSVHDGNGSHPLVPSPLVDRWTQSRRAAEGVEVDRTRTAIASSLFSAFRRLDVAAFRPSGHQRSRLTKG